MSDVKHTPDTIMIIRDGRFAGVVVVQDDQVLRDTLAEWALDPTVTEMIRAPLSVARTSFDSTVDEIRAAIAKATQP